jgi:hypothetical protein
MRKEEVKGSTREMKEERRMKSREKYTNGLS